MLSFGRKTELVQIDGTSAWVVAKDHESNTWIAVCKELNLNAMGGTWEELQQAIAEVITALFTDLLKHGELDDFLRRNGWSITAGRPTIGSKNRFDLPYETKRLEGVGAARDLVMV